jgi:hypothetical protein
LPFDLRRVSRRSASPRTPDRPRNSPLALDAAAAAAL